MLSKKQIEARLEVIDSVLYIYNDIFRMGYRMALEDVLEIKLPKAIPAKTNKTEDEIADVKNKS